MSHDHFRPSREPTRSIYDALVSEMKLRRGRSFEEWSRGEIQAVYEAALRLAPAHGLRTPTMADVEDAERYARGSADYGSKWVIVLVNALGQPLKAKAAR